MGCYMEIKENSVVFAKNNNDSNCELKIRELYKKSRHHTDIWLDFSVMRYSGVFSISKLLVVCEYLHRKKKAKLHVLPMALMEETPPDVYAYETICGFFGSWGIWPALSKVGVDISEAKAIYDKRLKDDRLSETFKHFDFYNTEKSYLEFVSSLNDEKVCNEFFSTCSSLDIINSGGLQTILLREIGKNAFEHGRGLAAHIAIGKIPSISEDVPSVYRNKVINRSKSMPEYSRPFFRKIEGSGCLEIVISDAGPGIISTLKNSYSEDNILKDKKVHPNGSDILEYSFCLHSSSKPESWYNDPIKHKYKTPKGLFFVKNFARSNSALLICRSQRSLFALDFYNSKSGIIKSISGKNLNKVDGLVNIHGAQLQILIPLKFEKKYRRPFYSVQKNIDLIQITKEVVIKQVADFKPIYHSVNETDKLEIAKSLVVDLINSGISNKLIVYDFIGTQWTKDSLFPIVHELGHLSLDNNIIGLLHFDHIEGLLNEIFFEKVDKEFKPFYIYRDRPILKIREYDGRITVDILGLKSKVNDVFKTTNLEVVLGNVSQSHYSNYLDALIDFKANEPKLLFNKEILERLIVNRRKNALEDFLTNEKYGVFHGGKFLLPSSVYVEGFYEVGAIFDYPDAVTLLYEFIKNNFLGSGDRHLLIFLSEIGQKLMDLFEEYSILQNSKKLCFTTIGSIAKLNIDQEVENIIFIVDVIATGNHLSNYLKMIERKLKNAEVKVFCIVDTRPRYADSKHFRVDNVEYKLFSVVRRNSVHYEKRPSDWAYEDIFRIDNILWKPIYHKKSLSTYWTIGEFLNKACVENNSMKFGHFFYENRNHYKIFFYNKKIVSNYNKEIIDKIIEGLQESFLKVPKSRLSYIIYPDDSIGIDRLAYRLNVALGGGINILPIKRNANPITYMKKDELCSVVIGLDTATSSHKTVSGLLEIAANLNAQFIYVFVIMSRSAKTSWRFINRITGYNSKDTKIKTLARVDIPAFQSDFHCPMCMRLKDLENLKRKGIFPYIEKAINRDIRDLTPVEINQLLNDKEWESETDIKLKEIIEFRILLEEQKEDYSAWEKIECCLKKRAIECAENLILSGAFEAIEIYGKNTTIPKSYLFEIIKKAEEIAFLTNRRNVLKASIELLFTRDWKKIEDFILKYITIFHSDIDKLTEITIEILVYIERNPDKRNSVSKFLKNLYENMIEKKLGSSVTLSLINSVAQDVKYDSLKVKDTGKSSYRSFLDLIDILKDRRGGAHSYINECLTKIAVEDPNKILKRIGTYYCGKDNLSDIVENKIIPCIYNLQHLISEINDDRKNYLLRRDEQCLSRDIRVLNDSILMIKQYGRQGPISQDEFQKIYKNEDISAVHKRLGIWLRNDGLLMKILINNFVCKYKIELDDMVEDLHEKLKIIGAILHYEDLEYTANIFARSKVFTSVIDSIFENIKKYPFSNYTDGDENKKAVGIWVYDKNGTLEIWVGNTGEKISEKREALIARLSEILKNYDGIATYENVDGYTTTIRTVWQKLEVDDE